MDDEERVEKLNGDLQWLRRTTEMSKYATLSFGFVGIACLYMTIFLWDLTLEYRVLYLSVLSLSLAVMFLFIHSYLMENLHEAEKEKAMKRNIKEILKTA